jgi:hypothetical protein
MISNAIAAATVLALVAGAQAMTETQAPSVATPQLPPTTITVPPPGSQPQKSPFDNLVFTPSRLDSRVVVTTKTRQTPAPQWKVECGIKVIVVNPDIDPKMIVTPQPGATEPYIRRIGPPACPERSSNEEVVVKKPPAR